jgi:16S rRNA (uracil1498-N3)-methyltransferase
VRLTRVPVDAPLAAGARVALPAEAAAHLQRVLRLQPGDACVLFNGDGRDYEARIATIHNRGVDVEVVAVRDAAAAESPLRIVLLQGIARGEKMDWILQKATELGIAAIVPVHSERSEVRLDAARAAKRLEHWRGVVASACGQSGRAVLPPVSAPVALADALAGPDVGALDEGAGARYLLDPEAAESIASMGAPGGACTLAVGPEGGWSPRDRTQLLASGFRGVRLGPRILRTETAGLAALAALQARFGDL